MALWKPFRGNRAALDTAEKHDGYVYFCVDDGSLFFDYTDAEGNLQRKQINAKDAETITGASLSTILNSSDLETPTSKAVLDALETKATKSDVDTQISELSSEVAYIDATDNENIEESTTGGGSANAVLYTKQELTPEQQEQARNNIGVVVDDIPKVYFTGTLPTSKDDEDVRLSMRYISKTEDFSYPVTLKVQGSSSTNYPKKNFTMKVYKDSTYEKKQKLAFKNWGEMSKFVLKAHWIDHSHVRNVGTAKIWGKIVQSRSDYASLPKELRNAPNNGATDGFTCKVFCNGVYQGLYEWIVPKDKLFGQDSDIATHSIMNSEWNNQPTCAFSTTAPTISGNWSEELQDNMSDDISTSFANLIKFVAGSTDEEFVKDAEKYFDVQSVIDFDIFARVFCIVDNLCRNQIFFTYDGVKWYEGCWDVDAVLGLPPTKRGFFDYRTEFQTGYIAYKDYGVTNLLYQRVETLFKDRFEARYAELRSGVLSIENILDVYERLTDVITTYDGLLAEDYASTTGDGKFTEIPYTSENNIQQIRAFVSKRIPYMDFIIAAMTESEIPLEDAFKYKTYINYNTGTVEQAASNTTSYENYIPVFPNTKYRISCTDPSATMMNVLLYDNDKKYVFDTNRPSYYADLTLPAEFTIPDGYKYIRFHVAHLNKASADVVTAETVKLERV